MWDSGKHPDLWAPHARSDSCPARVPRGAESPRCDGLGQSPRIPPTALLSGGPRSSPAALHAERTFPPPPCSRTEDTTGWSPNETDPVLRPRVCSAGSAHRGGLERCRPSSTGRVRSWDPLAAESLNRVTSESTPRGQLLGSSASECGAARRVSRARKSQHALPRCFYLETPAGTERGAAAGRAALGADGLVLNALCRGTPAGFRLGRKSKRGVCPPMEEPRLSERVTEAAAVPGVRLTGGAPPSSPNPRKLQTRNHDPPGARRPWGRSLRRPPAQSVQGTPRIRLQGTSASARTPTSAAVTVPGFSAQEAGARIPGNANRGVQSLGTELEASC